MINIVHVNIHCNDLRKITAIDIKLKFVKKENESTLVDHALVATIAAAFFKTTLLTDEGESLKITPNPKRHNIVNLGIDFEDTNISFQDVANFSEALQAALDDTELYF